uniref:Vacuolar protein sorting-associated protein 13A n=1 Tax=Syphacia muris TaxID=451379 RepID=A0A0N5ABX3_9BILA
MVFESVVADLLNRFLGDFVDNLDASQLNIGIWGGDVKLDNLEIKETALDEMELPIKLKYGYLKSLKLKIPWKSLYTEPVIAEVDGFYMIVVPNKGVVYNEEKAKKNEQDEKRKKLLRLEENRKRKRKEVEAVDDGFTEKLLAQIVKNLQVHIRNIHVRYEDKYTNRHRPFAVGVTLEQLQFLTTDSNWIETIHKEAVKIVYKLVSLNNLAVYWNSDCRLISDADDRIEIERLMIEGIANNMRKPSEYTYIIQPITMKAKLSMNQKPESTNWEIPKIDLIFDMETLALCIGKLQYQDILLVLDAQERSSIATRYLKYRPDLNEYAGHYKTWWHFAYMSILEEQIKRKKRNWSWEHMKQHRYLVRNYKEAWIKKQTEKNIGQKYLKTIEEAEEVLDIFNINIARQQAEFEIDRLQLTRLEDQPQGWISWAKSWWGSSTPSASKPKELKEDSANIVAQFEEAMTTEEKAKLYDAIDYQENTPPTDYPKEFVENVVNMNLTSVEVIVENSLHLKFKSLSSYLQQRPSANAINLTLSIKSVEMIAQGTPMLTMSDSDSNWLSVVVDTNPLDKEKNNYDQYFKLCISPTLFKYHALAVNALLDVLKPPESVRLHKLAAAAMARYEDVKERSLTGLSHAVEMKSKLLLDISIAPATVVISETGVFGQMKTALILDLGLLEIKSIDDQPYQPSTVFEEEKSVEERRKELLKRAYDKFNVKLSNIRITLGDDYEMAVKSLQEPLSNCHILRPTGMDIQVYKSAIDDIQLPK